MVRETAPGGSGGNLDQSEKNTNMGFGPLLGAENGKVSQQHEGRPLFEKVEKENH